MVWVLREIKAIDLIVVGRIEKSDGLDVELKIGVWILLELNGSIKHISQILLRALTANEEISHKTRIKISLIRSPMISCKSNGPRPETSSFDYLKLRNTFRFRADTRLR